MAETRRKFRLFWAWNLEKETAWLARMSAAGWHLSRCGLGVYHFHRGNPEDRVYELDFMVLRNGEAGRYFQLYEDSGWTHVTSLANWHYFHAPKDLATRRPVFTDAHSRRSRLIRVLAVLGLAILPVAAFGLVDPLLNGYYREAPIYYGISGFAIVIISIFLYAVVRITFKVWRSDRS
jgi:hypothetical protein